MAKAKKKNVVSGRAYIQAGFSNTIITVTDPDGKTVCWSSAGKLGFKGNKKGTPFAAQIATENAMKAAMASGLRSVDVYVKGPGSGRESSVRCIANMGIKITTIRDVTPIPHNGCRPPKRRRV